MRIIILILLLSLLAPRVPAQMMSAVSNRAEHCQSGSAHDMSVMMHEHDAMSNDAAHQHQAHKNVSLLLIDGCAHCPDCNGSVGALLNTAMLPVLMVPVAPVVQLHTDHFNAEYCSRLYRPPLVLIV